MQFIKIRDVKDPVRNVDENAGIDFYVPEYNEKYISDILSDNFDMFQNFAASAEFLELIIKTAGAHRSMIDKATGTIYVAPHHDIKVPTGIMSKFGNDLALIANNKSGVATKKKFVFGASVIDCSYQGEWHIHVINTSDDYQVIKCGEKLIQFIPHKISTDPVEVVDKTPEEFYTEKTLRGDGWAGSTGVK